MPIRHNIDKNSETLIRSMLEQFNLSFAGADNHRSLSLSIDDKGEIMGGLLGGTYWGYLYLDILVVNEDYRNRGYGSMLLDTAEKTAVDRGCQHATLGTHDFQGIEFYIKNGYRVAGQLPDLPRGHTKYTLYKKLVT